MCNDVQAREIQEACTKRGVVLTHFLLEELTLFYDVIVAEQSLFSFEDYIRKIFDIPEKNLKNSSGKNPVEKFFNLLKTEPNRAQSLIFPDSSVINF